MLLSRVAAAEELLRAQQQQKAAADEAAALAFRRRPSTEKKQEPPAFSRVKKADPVLRQPADHEPIAQQSHLRRPQNPSPRPLRVPTARVEVVPASSKSAPAASTKSRRESLIPRFTRVPSSQGQQQQTQPQSQSQAQQQQSRRKSIENTTASANARVGGERSWLSATLKSVTRQSSLPSTRTAFPAAAAAASGISSTTATNRRHTIAPSTKRRPPPARDSRTAVRESPM